MLNPNFFNSLFVFPILNILVAFYKFFLLIKIPGAFGLAIIALTVLIRFILHPFFKQQIYTAKKMQDIKPHLDLLHHKHKADPKKLQAEQLRLYKEHGINPATGCLFMIIQLPIFIALYNTLSVFLNNGNGAKIISQINKAVYSPFLQIQTIDPWFYGFNLALSPSKAGGAWQYYLIPLITGFLQYLQAHYSQPHQGIQKDLKKNKKGDAKKKESTQEDFQKAMNTQMKYLFPLLIGWFSYGLPVGLSLYWNIFSLFSIIQYQRLHAKA